MDFKTKKDVLSKIEAVAGSLNYYKIGPKDQLPPTTINMGYTCFDPGPTMKAEAISPAIREILEAFKNEVREERIKKAREILAKEGESVDGFDDIDDDY